MGGKCYVGQMNVSCVGQIWASTILLSWWAVQIHAVWREIQAEILSELWLNESLAWSQGLATETTDSQTHSSSSVVTRHACATLIWDPPWIFTTYCQVCEGCVCVSHGHVLQVTIATTWTTTHMTLSVHCFLFFQSFSNLLCHAPIQKLNKVCTPIMRQLIEIICWILA